MKLLVGLVVVILIVALYASSNRIMPGDKFVLQTPTGNASLVQDGRGDVVFDSPNSSLWETWTFVQGSPGLALTNARYPGRVVGYSNGAFSLTHQAYYKLDAGLLPAKYDAPFNLITTDGRVAGNFTAKKLN